MLFKPKNNTFIPFIHTFLISKLFTYQQRIARRHHPFYQTPC